MNRKAQIFSHIKHRLFTPAVGFLLFTIVLSITIFIFAMRSGVAEVSLPPLRELSVKNVHSIKSVYQVEKGVGVTSLIFSPDGKYLAVARQDDILHVWSTQDYHLIYTFNIEPACMDCVTFSPDSRYIATVRETRPYDVIVWDTETGKSPWESENTPNQPGDQISSLLFSPDGKYLAEAIGSSVLFWMVGEKEFTLVRDIEGFSNQVESLAFSPDGRRLLTTNRDQTAKVWDVETGNWLMTLDCGDSKVVTKAVFSPDSSWIVTAEETGTIRFWDSQTGFLISSLESDTAPVTSLVFSSNGELLAANGNNDRIFIWDAHARKKLVVLAGVPRASTPITFSPDNKIFATTIPADTVRLWGVVR